MDTLYLNNKQYRAAQFKHCHLRKKWHELSLVRKKCLEKKKLQQPTVFFFKQLTCNVIT